MDVIKTLLVVFAAISSARVASALFPDAHLYANGTRFLTGVRNPYALAEIVARRNISWKTVSDKPRLLEDILGIPYQELFEPSHKSLLFNCEKLPRVCCSQTRSPKFQLNKTESAIDRVRKIIDQSSGALIWRDPGTFFNEAAEFSDPLQGAAANCYFIAALSAVAWALPYDIKHMTRATGLHNQQFTNMITFYKQSGFGFVGKNIEVTDAIPMKSPTEFKYSRSREWGEIWPAVYEKAFAKFRTNVAHDFPNIDETSVGSTVFALAELTGRKPIFFRTNMNVARLMKIMRENAPSDRTINPMVAVTFACNAQARQSGRNINFADASIVPFHAYTILGWDLRNGVYYIILRDPFGVLEASKSTLGGIWRAYDISWWREINLIDRDGVFGLEASAFLAYFIEFGVAL